jgi:hypothetical protein
MILSYYANANGLACSHHIDDRLDALDRAGVSFDLFSGRCGPRCCRWNHRRILCLAPSLLRHELRMKRKSSNSQWKRAVHTILMLPVLPFYALESMFFRFDPSWWWALSATARGAWELCRRDHTTIYSTGGPPCAHLAALALSRMFGQHWIAEMQDPLIHSYCSKNRFERRFLVWIEKQIFRHASEVVFLTEGALKSARSRTGAENKGVFLYPGAPDITQPDNPNRDGVLTVVHCGSLSGARSPLKFFEALRLFLERQQPNCDTLRVELHGDLDPEYQKAVGRFPFPEALVWAGKTSRENALERMRAADVLLLVQAADDVSGQTIPSKTYEYLRLEKLVFGLIHENPELRKMLASLGHIAVDAKDTQAIHDGFHMIRTRFKSPVPPRTASSPFTTKAAAGRLIESAAKWETTRETTKLE